ncbi:hypothetical protein AYL99_08510 [Fonsecaea erecta]|uniref:Uncharacterized protein n=1 Tax=Fonsecaea erecta TaxID=1367422 RepID=A0A178ZDN3_9EURO|nr:hypothetical protein AYL99_08510 [Fonsecaea erecta]OAP57772.1 hypothetical protein AYL99_08510 [Fonsecaea erecta]
MPVKSWTDTEKLTLLRTAIMCSPNFKLDANKVAEMWPGDDDNARPNARSVRDNFRAIMKHGDDLETLRKNKQGAAAKDEDAGEDDKVDAGPTASASSTPKPPLSTNPVNTPRLGLNTIGKRSTAKKPTTGSKRKRRTVSSCSDGNTTSATETTSGDEADITSPTPRVRRALPVRNIRRTARAASEDGSYGTGAKDVDAGAKDLDTEGSDGEYDLAKERKEKAERKAKLARRSRK